MYLALDIFLIRDSVLSGVELGMGMGKLCTRDLIAAARAILLATDMSGTRSCLKTS